MLKLLGLVLVLGGVAGGFVLSHGMLIALWQPAEMGMIICAVVGSFMMGTPKPVQLQVLVGLKSVVTNQGVFDRTFYLDLLKLMFELLDFSRRQGRNALEEHIETPEGSSLFQKYPAVMEQERVLHFVTDSFRVATLSNIAISELENSMEQELQVCREDLKRAGHALQRTADACPGFGIVAAVLGIIITMQSIDGPVEMIGVHVAAALVGTFFGVLLCYGVLGPLAAVLDDMGKAEVLACDCVKSALVAGLRGYPPAMAVDAGRRVLLDEDRPSFVELEDSLRVGV